MGESLGLSAEEVLTTTRSVRKRLDLTRPVSREVIIECIEMAHQAPTGSNAQGWSWMIVDDPEKRKVIADAYGASYWPYREERSRLRHLAEELGVDGQVEFRGEVSDDELLDCYRGADLFVLANRVVDGDFEGFGMVLVEAQASGVAVVAGSSGGTRETMQVGVTGELVRLGDAPALARAMLRAWRGEAPARRGFQWDSPVTREMRLERAVSRLLRLAKPREEC